MDCTHKLSSDISKIIDGLIDTKKAAGFKYEKEERILRQFDSYYRREGYTGIHLTKEMTDGFIYEPGCRPSTYRIREKTLRELGEYATDMGYTVFIVPVVTAVPASRHIPYILSDDELRRIFAVIDNQRLSDFTDAAIVDPTLFRVLYSTGMRLSEALRLMVSDVDLEKMILTVRISKNGEGRLVPFGASLGKQLTSYVDITGIASDDDRYFFPGQKKGQPIDKSTVYQRFRDYLLEADVPHSFRSPCPHSFRHGFAVGCLKKWVREGKDLTTCLPYLMTYMGHSDLRATQYYLRLTADMYPEIIAAVEAQFGYIIPGGD